MVMAMWIVKMSLFGNLVMVRILVLLFHKVMRITTVKWMALTFWLGNKALAPRIKQLSRVQYLSHHQ